MLRENSGSGTNGRRAAELDCPTCPVSTIHGESKDQCHSRERQNSENFTRPFPRTFSPGSCCRQVNGD
jgi:hypothetical protein